MKKILPILIILLFALGLSNTVSGTSNDFKDINTNGLDLEFDENDVKYEGKIVGNITKIDSVADGESLIRDNEAIKQLYSDGIIYLGNEGQYYIFDHGTEMYLITITESGNGVGGDLKLLCSQNSDLDYNNVPGASSPNGFDFELGNS